MRLIKKLVDILFWSLLLVFGLCFVSDSAAVLFDERLGTPLRIALSYPMRAFSVPIFEIMVIGVPLLLIFLLADGRIFGVISVAKLLIAAYIVTLGIPARVPPRTAAVSDPTTEQYALAADIICKHLGALPAPQDDTFAEAAIAAAEYAERELDIEQAVPPRIKLSLAPAIIADMGIVAYYAFPTAEIITCTYAPDFMTVFSIAHETMHFFGIANEDEANLFALAALLDSANESLEYSAYMCAFVYVGSVLCIEDRDTYDEIYAKLPDFARESLDERTSFLKRGEGKLGSVSDALNDVAITLRDPRGADSYSSTSRLVVEYLLQ